MTKHLQHESAVRNICSRLNRCGLRVKKMQQSWCSYDVLVNNMCKVEVKTAVAPHRSKTSTSHFYLFNLHRHGIIKGETPDFFVCFLPPFTEVGFKVGIMLVIPHEVIDGRLNLIVSLRTLIIDWGRYANRMDLIESFCSEGQNLNVPIETQPSKD